MCTSWWLVHRPRLLRRRNISVQFSWKLNVFTEKQNLDFKLWFHCLFRSPFILSKTINTNRNLIKHILHPDTKFKVYNVTLTKLIGLTSTCPPPCVPYTVSCLHTNAVTFCYVALISEQPTGERWWVEKPESAGMGSFFDNTVSIWWWSVLTGPHRLRELNLSEDRRFLLDRHTSSHTDGWVPIQHYSQCHAEGTTVGGGGRERRGGRERWHRPFSLFTCGLWNNWGMVTTWSMVWETVGGVCVCVCFCTW